jgi:hypothetical protein
MANKNNTPTQVPSLSSQSNLTSRIPYFHFTNEGTTTPSHARSFTSNRKLVFSATGTQALCQDLKTSELGSPLLPPQSSRVARTAPRWGPWAGPGGAARALQKRHLISS